jgi:quercetin dioxygenase-like cupin family protein
LSENSEPNSLWFMNGHVTIHLSKTANADGISITEHLLPAGFGPPFHIHRDEDETFYVLEGEFRFKHGETIQHAQAGDVVYLPKGMPHGFRVLSAGGGRCLIITRGGFENMLRSASRSAPAVTLPQQVEPTPEMQARLAAICAENGIDLIGPPID